MKTPYYYIKHFIYFKKLKRKYYWMENISFKDYLEYGK